MCVCVCVCVCLCVCLRSVFFRDRILDGSRCLKKNSCQTRKQGGIIAHYCAISPSQPPFIAYNIAQYIFPTTPFIAAIITYWQYLVSKGQVRRETPRDA